MDPKRLLKRLIPTLWEDDYLLAVAKPAGVDVGGQSDRRGGGLIDLLCELRGGDETLTPINRLRLYESGVLLLGKDPAIVEPLRANLRAGKIKQEFAAVVTGRMDRPRMELVPRSAAPRRDEGRKAKGRTRPASRSQKTATRTPRRQAGEPTTNVKSIKVGKGRTYVRCTTNVANTHALRAQLRGARLRLLGDGLHDRSRRPDRVELTCLHLAKMVFRHPAREVPITLTCRAPMAIAGMVDGKRDVERPLAAALTRRLPCLMGRETNSFRLLTGRCENLRGLVAEKYGPVVILEVREDSAALKDSLRDIARWYQDHLGVEAVLVKDIVGGAGGLDAEPSTGVRPVKPIVGMPVRSELIVMERGLKFEIHPHAGRSVGLFLDQRENRRRVREMAAGKSVLNLFAYTCGFSVAAAAGGASRTVSVDLAPGQLEWGKRNFALNGLDTSDQAFIRSDAAGYLKRAAREGMSFELIVIDAPTFAHAGKRGQSFSFVRDLPALVRGASALLLADGIMLISTNNRALSMSRLKELVKQGAGRRRFRVLATPPLPLDFAVDSDHAKTMILRFA